MFMGYVPEEIQPRTPADQMKLFRGILGLEQKELAGLLGVADTSISRWENGKYPLILLLLSAIVQLPLL